MTISVIPENLSPINQIVSEKFSLKKIYNEFTTSIMFCHPVILQFLTSGHFETSLAMVSFYDYEIWRHKKQVVKPFLSENACLFNFFKKREIGGWNDTKCLFMCYFNSCTYLFRDFKLISNPRKIQDGDHCWWRHRPPTAPPPIKYTSSCWEDHRLSTECKIVSKYCSRSKTLGRGSINPTPHTTVGVEFASTPEGKLL